MDDGIGEDAITEWAILASFRMARAAIFAAVAIALLWVSPYQLANPFITAIAIGVLSLINQGSRVSLVAIGVLLLLAIIPKEVVLGLV
ncbi:MAG TPA: hypothetical protein VJ846_07075 [Sphingomicrobium sp.]|nr:hypothetical protein [Sphingomicrobium sp.]